MVFKKKICMGNFGLVPMQVLTFPHLDPTAICSIASQHWQGSLSRHQRYFSILGAWLLTVAHGRLLVGVPGSKTN